MNDIKSIQKKILPILKSHQVKRAAIFGSFARGEQTKKSDLDLLIEFKGRKGLFSMAALRLDLKDLLKRDIDLVTYNSINHRLRQHILSDLISIL